MKSADALPGELTPAILTAVAEIAGVIGAWCPSLSPTGDRIAYVTDRSGLPRLEVAHLDRTGLRADEAPRLVSPPHQEVVSVAWSPDGQWLAYLVSPGGLIRAELHVIRPDGTDSRLLAGGDRQSTVFAGCWTALPHTYAYSLADGRGPDAHVRLIDVTTGSSRLVAEGGFLVVTAVSPDGRRLIARRGPRGRRHLVLGEIPGPDADPVAPPPAVRRLLARDFPVEGTDLAEDGRFAAGESGESGVYLRTVAGRDRYALGFVPLASDGTPGRLRVPAERVDADLESYSILGSGPSAMLVWNVDGISSVEIRDLSDHTGYPIDIGRRVMPGWSVHPAGQSAIFELSEPVRPRSLYHVDLDDPHPRGQRHEPPQRVAGLPQPSLDTELLSTPDHVTFTSADGVTVHGLSYRPVAAYGPQPTMILLHGGPESQERPAFSILIQSLVAAGMAVFAPNVRGSTGYGLDFMRMDDLERRESSFQDVPATVDYLVSSGMADPDRIGVHGWSYGGYLALIAVTRWPDLFTSGSSHAGMSDLADLLRRDRDLDGRGVDHRIRRPGHRYGSAATALAARSAFRVHRADSVRTRRAGHERPGQRIRSGASGTRRGGTGRRDSALAGRGTHHRGTRRTTSIDCCTSAVAHPVDGVTPTGGGSVEAPGGQPLRPAVLAGYPAGPLDEAVGPDGRVRPGYEAIMRALDGVGVAGLRIAADHLNASRMREGISFIAEIDGVLQEQPFPLDPIPRVLSGADWASIGAGLAQRTRALNTFLDDVYGERQIVKDGVIAESVIDNCPGFLPAASDLAPGGRPRAGILGFDLLHAPSGRWVVLEDNLRVPSGLGYAVASRRTAAAALTMLHPWPGLRSPESVGAALRDCLAQSAPPNCRRGTPRIAVLSDGPDNSAWYEHRLLAAEMGVPVVHPGDLGGGADGVTASVDGRTLGVDVLYRRLGDDELIAGPSRSPAADSLLLAASRAGSVSVVNTPGNGVADDKAVYAFVHTMISYYFGEQPLIGDVGTWVLADPGQYESVRDRLHELVVKPVDGSGGAGVMIGPDLDDTQVAAMRARVAAAPHRYIAQEVIRFSAHPTLTTRGLAPRHVDLRVFALAGADGAVVVPDVALSRVALESDGLLVNSSRGGGSKDTWLPV